MGFDGVRVALENPGVARDIPSQPTNARNQPKVGGSQPKSHPKVLSIG
jgi:hypothetical protein